MPYPLEDFYSQSRNLQPTPSPTFVKTDFSQMCRDTFRLAIPSIPQMDEHTLVTLIKNNIDCITKDILNNDSAYVTLLRDQKFISAFIHAVSSIPIQYDTKIACNKITYDYFTSTTPESHIKSQYLNMSKIINRDAIDRLKSIGLDENTASNLALCRYSSFIERVNVKRLNFSMYYRDPEIMTEQIVVWIYEKLFNRISDLFYGTMFEVYPLAQQNEFGENFMEVYGTVGLVVLIILNNMTTEQICKVLLGYHEEWLYKNKPAVRFSLNSLSNDFSRIRNAVDKIYSDYGILVP